MQAPGICMISCDLSDWNKTRQEVSKIKSIDLLINNAAVATTKELLDVSKDDVDE